MYFLVEDNENLSFGYKISETSWFIDTEPLYTKATQNVVGKYGKTFTWDIKAGMMGLHRADASKYMVEKLNIPLTWQEYDSAIHQEYKVVLANPSMFPGK